MMLKFTEMRLPSANLGQPNVLPDVKASHQVPRNPPVKIDADLCLSPDEGAWVDCGRIHSILPYTMQDGYDRKLSEKSLKTAVLENEYLRAEFAAELGGRLWSLYSKTEKRELFFKNDVFQPANLALRNAWFSGGIEWNIGMIGHHPYTCSPMFTSYFKNASGGETLKMYEYERKRGLVYTIMAALAGDALLVRVTIENLSGRDTYVYWWSNGAIEETPQVRVIVPADSYYSYGYDGKTGSVTVSAAPVSAEAYYPANHDHAFDYFYKIPENRHRFMSYFDGDGHGMAQFSTQNELGRKLFVWGTQNSGGKNWNRWLSRDGRYYAELQAGLLHSQREHRPMPAGEVIQWTEGYTAVSCDREIVHGEDYAAANRYVEDMLEASGRFESVYAADDYFTAVGEEKIMSYGSGWGALEELARQKSGETEWRLSRISRFPIESVYGKPEEDFLTLLNTGKLPPRSPKLTEDSVIEYCMGGRFIKALEAVQDKDWYTWLELACAYYEANSFDAARAAFMQSIRHTKNPIALRSLAWIYAADANRRGDIAQNLRETGKELMKQAAEMSSYCRLIIDAIVYMQVFGDCGDVVSLIEACGEECKSNGRIALFYAQNLARAGRIDEAVEILRNSPEVSDIREGEVSTSAVWTEVHRALIARDECRAATEITSAEVQQKYPIPQEIDFRMN